MNDASKNPSLLVQAVVALDAYFTELERLGNKINSFDMKTEFEFAQAQRLMARFAECGQGVSAEVMNLSNYLNEARIRADALAQGVANRAALLNSRKTDEQAKLEEFRLLGEKVRTIVNAMNTLKRPENSVLSEEDRQQLAVDLSIFEQQLSPLIEQAQNLRREAHQFRMKSLEQNADSLAQTLIAARTKISSIHLAHQ